MSSTRVLSVGVVMVTFFLGVLEAASPPPVHAAWVNGTQFQVGGALTTTIVPTAAGTTFVDPTCGSQGGTSLALVPGLKLLPAAAAIATSSSPVFARCSSSETGRRAAAGYRGRR